jgi:hypothetical protein
MSYIKEISVNANNKDEILNVLGILDPQETITVKYQGYPDNCYTFQFPDGWFSQDDLQYNPIEYTNIVYYT